MRDVGHTETGAKSLRVSLTCRAEDNYGIADLSNRKMGRLPVTRFCLFVGPEKRLEVKNRTDRWLRGREAGVRGLSRRGWIAHRVPL